MIQLAKSALASQICGCLSVVLLAMLALGADYAEQKTLISKAGRMLRSAERFASAGRNDDAVAAFAEAQKALQAASVGLDEKLERIYERAAENFATIHQQLKSKGVALPPLGSMKATMSAPGGGGGAADGDQVSFTKQIAPMLVGFCGKCHVDGRRGQFSMRSHSDLISSGMIEVGSAFESTIVEVIAGNSMPPTGDTLSPQQAALLVKWINQGARFDGDDPNKSLREIKLGDGTAVAAAPVPAPVPVAPKVTLPTGKETVSFALDVAPLLIDQCMACHNAGQDRAGLNVATFTSLFAGSDSGPVVSPKNAERSLLVQKIRGTSPEGARMPLNKPPLSDDQISTIVTWIAEGAAFDGSDPGMSLERVNAIARAAIATPEQLAEMRRDSAVRKWQLALPDERAEHTANEHFDVVGNLTPAQLSAVMATAETELAAVKLFFAMNDADWLKGPLTIYALPDRIDYAEFRTMAERRETDRTERGHAQFDPVEPYIAFVVDDDEEMQAARLSDLIGQIAAANRGNGGLPPWFIVGSGMAAATKAHPRSSLVTDWDATTDGVIRSVRSAKDFLSGGVAPTTRDIVARAFVTDIRGQRGKYDKIIEVVRSGKSFDDGVKAAYALDAEALAEAWLKSRNR